MALRRANERELQSGVSPEASWHDEYRDSADIYVGGVSSGVTLAQLRAAFSQYGRLVKAHLPTDDAGRSRGYAFLTYEQPESAVLAVDNFSGVMFHSRALRVDHARASGKRMPARHADRVAAILGAAVSPADSEVEISKDLEAKRQAVRSSMAIAASAKQPVSADRRREDSLTFDLSARDQQFRADAIYSEERTHGPITRQPADTNSMRVSTSYGNASYNRRSGRDMAGSRNRFSRSKSPSRRH